jgi:nitroreductase
MNGETALAFLQSRHSVRTFTAEPIARPVLERLLLAATSAPSSSNRQPWKFAVVTEPGLRARMAEAVRERAEEMKAIIRKGHHAEDFGSYGDFFFEPLAAAAAVVVPQYRDCPDLIRQLIESGGGDPARYPTAAAMQAELCSTSAACMALLLQAHAEGLGACWMAGPMIARDLLQPMLGIREPWHMVGAIALGHPASTPEAGPARKPLARVVDWFVGGGAG